MTERELQRLVVELAHIYGWESYHPWLSKHSAPGWPDLTLIRPPRLLLVELKSEKGVLTPAQLHWLEMLDRVPGVAVRVWRPSNLDDGSIAAELARKS